MVHSLARSRCSELSHLSPAVLKLTDRGFIRELLEREIPDELEGQHIHSCGMKILKRHLRKTIIQYVVRFDNFSTRTYIGLHRESDKGLGHTYSVLLRLRSLGFNEESSLRVPKPIYYAPSMSFLLMEKADGGLLATLFRQQETNLKTYAEGAAVWLAELHKSGVTTDRIQSMTDEIGDLTKYKKALLDTFPDLASTIGSISEHIVMALQGFPKVEAQFVHGDYHPENIFASPEHVTVIDFERSCMGDPAFDIGYFIAQVKMSYGSGPSTVEACKAFLEKYLSESSSGRDLDMRQRVYESETYLQRLYHTYGLLKLKPDTELASRWLTESERCLQKG